MGVNDKSIVGELATELLKCGFRQGENKQGNDPVLNQHKGQEEEDEIDKRTMPISREELQSGKCALKKTEDFDGNSDSTQEGYEGTWLTIPRSECLVKHSQWDKAIQTNVFKKPRRGRVNGRGVQTECAIEIRQFHPRRCKPKVQFNNRQLQLKLKWWNNQKNFGNKRLSSTRLVWMIGPP